MAKEKQSMLGLIVTAIIAVVIVILVLGVVFNLDKLLNRNVTNDDLQYNAESAIDYSQRESDKKISFTFSPVVDIKGLSFKFTVYDNNDVKISDKIVEVGDVKANDETVVVVDWAELDDATIDKVYKMAPTISSGRVKK